MNLFRSSKIFSFGATLIVFALILSVGYFIGRTDTPELVRMAQIFLLIVLVLIILCYPYLGIAITIASLPLLDILPSIPYASSAISLVGAVTMGTYFLHRLQSRRQRVVWGGSLLFGGLLILWMLVSNPAAALLPSNDNRNWAFTFLQLWLLAWLAAQLLDTPAKHRTVIWIFVLATFISAIYAISQGSIGESVKESDRAAGLAEGANSAARYFVVALVFVYYLISAQKNRIIKVFLLLGTAVLIYATLLTVSRTGMILLVGSLGMLFLQNFGKGKRWQITLIVVLAGAVVWFFADNIITISQTIVPAIAQGSDTVGIRYGLWQAGLRMWLAHPIQGVGVGQFSENLPIYAQDLLDPRRWGLGAHNMYVAMLAETGLVGLFLFVTMFALAIRSLLKTSMCGEPLVTSLAQMWLTIIVVLLIGGITKQDQYDKLVWIIIGIGLSVNWMGKREQSAQSY